MKRCMLIACLAAGFLHAGNFDADAAAKVARTANWGGPTNGPTRALQPGDTFENERLYKADRSVYEIDRKNLKPYLSTRSTVKGHDQPRYIAFHLKGIRNVTLDFGGATILMRDKIQPFLLEDCENVTIRNVGVRYTRSPFTQGIVKSMNDRELRLEVGKEFPIEVRGKDLYFKGESWTDGPINWRPCFMQFFDKTTRRGSACFVAFFAEKVDPDPSQPWAASSMRFLSRIEGNELVLTADRSLAPWKGGMAPGNYAVIAHATRDHSNCEMVDCANVKLENYRVFNGIGMGIFPFHCRNLILDGVKWTYDQDSPSVVANAADAIHAFSCSGDFIVRNCVVEGMIDDGLNVHGNYYTVESAKGDEIVAFTGLEPHGTTSVFGAGDRISVKKGLTMDEAAEYTIKAVRVVDDKHVAFTLDRPVAAHQKKDLIENMSAQCRLMVVDSRFGKANTHLRLQTRNGVLIDGCDLELHVALTGDSTYWFESSPCETVVIRNTRFSTANGRISSCPDYIKTKEHPHYHGDLIVENCTFENGQAVSARGLGSVTIRNCRATNDARVRVDRGDCPRVDQSVATPPAVTQAPPALENVRLPRIGRLVPRTRPDPKDDTWMIGCEVLDRDFAKFSAYRDYLPQLGVRSIRLQGGWAKCEQVKGRYDFAWLDEPVDFALRHGLNPVLETDYGNPLYKGGGGRDLAAGFPHGEEGLAAWDRWVDALSKHFRGRVRDWAMWNEPDIGNPADTDAVGGHHTPERIAAFNVRTAKIIRRNIPDARIAGLSLATNDPGFNEACFKAFGKDVDLFWRFIYHGYVPAPESSYPNVARLQQICARYAPKARLWQGENGAPSEMPGDGLALHHYPWSEITQAKWDLRRMLGDYIHNVPSSVFTICDYFHPGRGIGSYGLLRADRNRDVIAVKRAFYAVRNVATVFDSDTKLVDRRVSSPERTLWLWECERKGKPLFVFWKCGEFAEKDGWKMHYERPGDDCRTRPVVITHPGEAFAEPVWLDLLTGEVHAVPKEQVLPCADGVTYVNIPAYDSPCVLTERSVLNIK